MRRLKYSYFCSEDYSLIENYEKAKADNFKDWCIHHRLETHNFDGSRRGRDLNVEDLLALDMYLYRPASELIFMTITEHISLHSEGRQLSEEARRKISEARKGKALSEGHKRKIGEANKGHTVSSETRRKISEGHKGKYTGENNPWYGKHWFTNGVENKRCFECPEGFVKGRIINKEYRKCSKSYKNH